MGPKGKKKKGTFKAKKTYGSDDERAYQNEKQPDPESNEFYHDEVDDFHSNRDKILLEKAVNVEPAGFSSDEQEEVLRLDSDSDDGEVAEYKERLRKLRQSHHIKTGFQSESESEEDDEQAGIPSEKSWGKKKRRFYDGDVQDDDADVEGSGSEPEDAALEEQEALRLQKKMAEQLDDDDFGLDIFKAVSKPTEKAEEKIATDVSKMSRRDKLELLKKESPELLELIEDYKEKMSFVSERLLPLNELIKTGKIPPSSGSKYIKTKLSLYLNYCVNVSFYLMLKAKHSPQATSHPVVKRLVQHRKLMKEMEGCDQQMEPLIDDILKKLSEGKTISITPTSRPVAKTAVSKILKQAKKKAEKKRLKTVEYQEEEVEEMERGEVDIGKGGRSWSRKRKPDDGLTSGEREAMEFYGAIKRQNRNEEDDIPDGMDDAQQGEVAVENEVGEDGKRGVTYQILKNKGLQAPKKKELRNPRVKHRMKYRKAKIRRKGQVREVRTEVTRYAGELSGIRAGIKRSVKFK